jgi:hypothetical protein
MSAAIRLVESRNTEGRELGAALSYTKRKDPDLFLAGCQAFLGYQSRRRPHIDFTLAIRINKHMYRGFNLSVQENCFNQYYDDGDASHKSQRACIESVLDSFKDIDGSLIASKLTAAWFPNISADVFIAHSHQDCKLAVGLAGFLKYQFAISSFIDSNVWGYSDDLLRMVDDEYCWQAERRTYNYEKRNKSTTHVHTSIVSKDYIRGQITDSPWIYSEIAMTTVLQRRSLSDHRQMRKGIVRMDEALRMQYAIELHHLTTLDQQDMEKWRNAGRVKGIAALDMLYALKYE